MEIVEKHQGHFYQIRVCMFVCLTSAVINILCQFLCSDRTGIKHDMAINMAKHLFKE